MTIDLHTHSTASDGTDPPADLIAAAAAQGVRVLGLTDHDTTAGWAEALAALPAGMTLVPGLELSCVWDGAGAPISLHLLGYLPDPQDAALSGALAALRQSRLHRGESIVDLLAADGLPITWAQVQRFAAGGTVGRPHVARALVESGVVGSVTEAFAELLSSRSRYYVRKQDIPIRAGIALVLGAGGVPAFAHPLARRRGRVLTDEQVSALAAAGLAAIEVDHPDHTAEDRAHLAGLAGELGLIPLGSSDYHGTNKPTPLAECTTSRQSLDALLARARDPGLLG